MGLNELEVIEVLANEETIKNGDKEIFAEPHYSLINDYRADTLKLSPSVFQKIENTGKTRKRRRTIARRKSKVFFAGFGAEEASYLHF